VKNRTFRCSQRPYSRTEYKARNRAIRQRKRIAKRLRLATAAADAREREESCRQRLSTDTIQGDLAGGQDDEECPVHDGGCELQEHDG
jgi:hypothetical protein